MAVGQTQDVDVDCSYDPTLMIERAHELRRRAAEDPEQRSAYERRAAQLERRVKASTMTPIVAGMDMARVSRFVSVRMAEEMNRTLLLAAKELYQAMARTPGMDDASNHSASFEPIAK